METLVSRLIRLECYKATQDSSASLSILVADDERQIAHLLTISLKSLGHEVIATTDNGEDAVLLTLERHPDVVILDIDMPRLSGLDAAQQILEQYSVPIVISSGRSDTEALRRAQEINVQAYLVKPFSPAQLKSALAISLAHHHATLSAEVKIATLTNEIEVVRSVEHAVILLMERFGIGRKEALEKLEASARARVCSLAEVAKSIVEKFSNAEVNAD